MNDKKVITVFLTVGSVLQRLVEHLLPDPRFSMSPHQIRCYCKEPMRDKVSYFVARDLRKQMGRSTLNDEQQKRFCNQVEKYIEIHKLNGNQITDEGAVTLICSRWKVTDHRGNVRDLPFETALKYYKDLRSGTPKAVMAMRRT